MPRIIEVENDDLTYSCIIFCALCWFIFPHDANVDGSMMNGRKKFLEKSLIEFRLLRFSLLQ